MATLRPTRILVCVALPVLLISQSACYDSARPLTDPEDAQVDKRLIGGWKAKEKEGPIYYFVGRSTDDFIPKGMMVGRGIGYEDGKLDLRPWCMYLVSTKVGDEWYASLFEEEQPLKDWPRFGTRYQLVKYTVEGDQLTVWGMDYHAKLEVIGDKKLKGEEFVPGVHRSAHFTDTGENICKFLAKGGGKVLFPDKKDHKIVFSRVK